MNHAVFSIAIIYEKKLHQIACINYSLSCQNMLSSVLVLVVLLQLLLQQLQLINIALQTSSKGY